MKSSQSRPATTGMQVLTLYLVAVVVVLILDSLVTMVRAWRRRA